MFQCIILACFLSAISEVVHVNGFHCECGTSSESNVAMRIVGGRRVTPHSFPWAVAIRKNKRLHCGASLITDRHALCAGHCFKWDNYKALDAVIGADDLDNLGDAVIKKISAVSIHKEFTSTELRDENDIAIAILESPVKFGPTVLPVCLPAPGEDYSGWSSTIIGWGRVAVNGPASNYLLQAKLRILSNDDCLKTGLREYLVPTMMCAFAKRKDGCQGDSGGPLMVFESSGKYVQAGIVSWGIDCASPEYPGVYTRVSDYIPWIESKTKNGKTCS